MKKNKLSTTVFYVLLAVFIIVIVFPFYWLIITSFKPPEELWNIPPTWWPSRLYLGSYISAFTERPFLTYLKNSAIVATSTTAFAVFVTSFAGYALARLNFKGKNAILALALAVSMFPGIAIVSPLFLMMKEWGLLNSYLGLIITYTTITIPLSMWNLTTFFRTIPRDMEEAAKVDGASPFYTFIKIILPLAAPGIFTTAILVFIAAWNEFLFALTFNTKDALRTVPVGIAMFPGQYTLPWGDISAASVVVVLPLMIIVLLFQQRIVSGLTAGAVKG